MLDREAILGRMEVLKSLIAHAETDLASGYFQDVKWVMEAEIFMYAGEYRTLQFVLGTDSNIPLQYGYIITNYIYREDSSKSESE